MRRFFSWITLSYFLNQVFQSPTIFHLIFAWRHGINLRFMYIFTAYQHTSLDICLFQCCPSHSQTCFVRFKYIACYPFFEVNQGCLSDCIYPCHCDNCIDSKASSVSCQPCKEILLFKSYLFHNIKLVDCHNQRF